MPRRKAAPLVATRSTPQLLSALSFAGDLEQALEVGVVERRKLVGRWLYFEAGADVASKLEDVAVAVDAQLGAWLLSPAQFLRSPVARALGDVATRDAVEAIIPGLVRTGRLGALAMLTVQYQPYLAMYSWADEEEVTRQILAMREALDRDGVVSAASLPEPERARDIANWRVSVLKHGEFLGSVALRTPRS